MMRDCMGAWRISSPREVDVRVWILASLMGVLWCCALISPTAGRASACPNSVFLTGASAGLPDCRAYEQVSPSDKGGFAAYPTRATQVQVSPDGALAYVNFSSFPGALGNTALFAGHLSSRTPTGWQTVELTPEVPKARALLIYLVTYTFSEDLSQAVLQLPIVPLTPDAAPGVYNLFLRHSDGSYSLVNSAPAALSAEEQCPPSIMALCFLFANVKAYAGASADMSHILFESNAQFTEEAPETGTESLYESTGGQVRLVGILPDGTAAHGSTAGSGSSMEYVSGEPNKDQRVNHAISRDGSRVIFQATANGGPPAPEQNGLTEVYMRIGGSETIELSAPAPGATPNVTTPEPATFWAASEDGSRVFFTSSAELTTESNTGEANNSESLYEYDLTAKKLTDLTIDTSAADASTGAMVRGVVDASNDGSYVYFVANGELVPGKGVDGQPNLYMVHDRGKPVFIATLDGSGTCGFSSESSADACNWTPFYPELEAYVTPNGQHLGFMSTMSVPTANFPGGYNNVDQNTGISDSQVYQYTAPSAAEEESGEATGRLVCASCDPSGAPPVGNALIGGITQIQAAGVGAEAYKGISTPFYHARAISEDGARIVYSAPIPNANPSQRIFEYERNGAGSCTDPSGCHLMISDPSLEESDEFLGITPSGDDIFFATTSRLSANDQDNLRDVYDAKVGGGISTPPRPVRCEANCQLSTLPAGAPLLLGNTTGPSGNVSGRPAGSTARPTRAAKLAKALRACRAKANRRKRAACEAAARRRYGPPKKTHAKHAKSSNQNRRAK